MPLIVFVVLFCANIYLWALPISQGLLLVVAATLGCAFFAWMLWFVSRETFRRLPP